MSIAVSCLPVHIALGRSTIALGRSTIALGRSTIALVRPTIALGRSTIALGRPTIALGRPTIVLGRSIIALGRSTIALGRSTIALGVFGELKPRPVSASLKLAGLREKTEVARVCWVLVLAAADRWGCRRGPLPLLAPSAHPVCPPPR